MSSMYTVAKELFPPTGIERVVRCNFIRPDVLNVIVAKSSVLEIYNFTEPAQADELPHLELVASYRLNGIVTSMGVIKTISSGQHGLDSILVSFKDAKQEFLNNSHPTEIRVDPSRRCAVLSFFGDRLAVLPFRQDESSMGDEDNISKKWPYLPSYVIALSEVDIRIKNVIDMVFLYDFFEPTLAILFSPQQTWTGRLAVRKDTCSLVVVSLNITQKVYPVIYSIDQLPYDCTKIIAVPKPVGGLLVVSANALIHLDQGSTGMGVGVNGYVPVVTEFPLADQYGFEMALEGSEHVFLAPDQLLFTLRTGDMYVVQLQQEGRSLSGFRIEKAGRSMHVSCKCPLWPGYFFVGSRYGDSMLIKYSTKDETKKKKKSSTHMEAMDLDNELYGQDIETIADQKEDKSKDVMEAEMDSGSSKWQFEICDTITNTGPIVSIDIGQRASNEAHSEFAPQHEMVAVTGAPQNGSLVVFQRNIRPNVVRSTDALAGATCLWTVFCRKEIKFEGVSQFESRSATNTDEGVEENYDKLLVISKEDYTLILATGDELRQLPSSQFYVNGPTVAIGSLLEDTRIVQVYAGGARLLNADCKVTQLVPIDEHLSIVAASIVDPYILLQLHDGSALLLKGDMATKDVTIVSQSSVLNNLPIKSCCIYADTLNNILTVKEAPTMASLRSAAATTSSLHSQATSTKERKRKKKIITKEIKVVDEIDLDLYGPELEEEGEEEEEEEESEEEDVEMEAAKPDNDDVMIDGVNKAAAAAANPEGQSVQATHWCLIYRTDGALEIYHLPDFKEVFFFPHFDLLPDVLPDAPSHQDTKPAGHAREITEMVMVNIGSRKVKKPYLVVRSYRGNISLYKIYQHFPSTELDSAGNPIDLSDRLAIRFRKIPLDVVARETPDDDLDERHRSEMDHDDSADAVERKIMIQERRRRRKMVNLVPFRDVAGYEGVFVLGAAPLWIMSSGRGIPRAHPMICDGKIVCFTHFHNVNCKNGFITSNAQGNVRISQLPSEGIQYDMLWPIQKVPLKRTARHIRYHPTSQTYVAVTSKPETFIIRDEPPPPTSVTAPGVVKDAAAGTAADGKSPAAAGTTAATANGTADVANGASNVPPRSSTPGFRPETERQSLELISPVTWETVDQYEFQEYEIVTSLETVSLESSQDASGRKKFIAVGTSFIRGEDSAMRGTIYIFDIIDVVPEPDNPQTDHKLKLLCTEEVKGAVTAMAALCGYLLTCVVVRSFEDNEALTGIAFIDVQIYVTSVKVVKNTVMLADAYKSVWFVGFQDEPTKLVLLGKDYHPMEVMNVSYLIENQSLHVIAADAEKNIRLLQYAPYHVQSFSGQKLICRGDYHVGSQIQTTLSLPKIVLSGSDEGISHLTVAATLDGGLSMITPIPEKTSKRLALLTTQLVNGVQHVAGLNPRAYRYLQSKDRLNYNPSKGVLDGDLLFEFVSLPANRQKEMTKQTGTSVDRVMDDLAAISIAADHL
ncbi:Cleavage and polyadenylation specificity factor subunit 1 [Lunasporangiospora selenospora]|uniref:Cleavage and polyadenylation specificity factor subunit 1 n=1 Tax=Lunasporangiospora selenospora TaxID=979761 RepID=A0A9P6KJ14_9FUNG|nr:Cleavage and polyadenylation specificity factor subunit 1 [Lunasporangiospora selenospora]